MSRKGVEELIGRMVLDAQFRKQVQQDPKKAATGFDLTPGEIEGLTHVDLGDFDKRITGLDQRVSKGLQMN